jgi:hypothetical protein
VARGRFSKKGKWYSNIVNGTNEERLPRIVEGALSRLPPSPEAERVRRKSRAAVSATIAGQRWWTGGGLEPTKKYLLTSLRTAPWLLKETPVVEWLNRIASTLAGASSQPVRAVKSFWEEVREATGSDAAQHAEMRRLLGEMLSATAIEMRSGSPRRAWLVGGSAIFHDPGSWVNPGRLLRLWRTLSAHPASTAEDKTSSFSLAAHGPAKGPAFQEYHEAQRNHSMP